VGELIGFSRGLKSNRALLYRRTGRISGDLQAAGDFGAGR
jgi:hypothetical protein